MCTSTLADYLVLKERRYSYAKKSKRRAWKRKRNTSQAVFLPKKPFFKVTLADRNRYRYVPLHVTEYTRYWSWDLDEAAINNGSCRRAKKAKTNVSRRDVKKSRASEPGCKFHPPILRTFLRRISTCTGYVLRTAVDAER